MNNEYLNLVKQAKNKEMKLLLESYKEIQQLYKDVAKNLTIKSKKANKGSLSERWLKDYRKSIKKNLKELNKILYESIKDKIEKSANLQSSIQLDFFNSINHKYNLGMQQTFKNMFSKVPSEVVSELLAGNIYKDGRGLSKRIWYADNKVNGDIDYIINKGIIEKKSAYELAQDLQTYVNPEAKQDFEWKKVYPNIGNKKVDFNAQRLARTSINHAYFMSNIRSCSKNPFVECMHWELSLQHSIRMRGKTDICNTYANSDDYNLGKGNFPIKKVPVPHPQCLCTQYAVIPDSLEDIGTRLNKWVNGGSDDALNDWFNKYGKEFEINIEKYKSKVADKKEDSKVKKDDIINNKQTYLNSSYKESYFGKFEDKEVREWYIAHDKNIINLVDKSKSIKEKALEAHSLRNRYRTEARLMMKNREMAEELNKTRPNINFEDLVKRKMEKKNLSEEEAYLDIFNTAGKTNKEVNKKFNLD